MPRGSRLVNEQNIVEDVIQFNVAKDGKIYGVDAAWVVCDGIVRQFWPTDIDPSNPIVMSISDGLSYDTKKPSEGAARAVCNLDVRTGKLILSQPGSQTYEDVIAPPPRGTGAYLWKLDNISGNVAGNDPIGSWVDVYSEGSLGVKEYWVENAVQNPSIVEGEAQITIARDDGFGSPEAGTEVTKTIYFIAEVTGGNFILTSEPWTLEDIRINETAQAGFAIGPDGFLKGYEHGVVVISEQYCNQWNENFSCQVIPNGDTFVGSPTNQWLTLDQDRSWKLAIQDVGVVENNAKLRVTDGVRTVEKEIVVRAEYQEEVAESDISDDFTQYNKIEGYDETFQGGYCEIGIEFFVHKNGTIYVMWNPGGGPYQFDFPQDWNVNAPNVTDPENFEVRLDVVSGDTPFGPIGIWENMNAFFNGSFESWLFAAQAEFDSPIYPRVDTVVGTYLLQIREVGRPSSVKQKTFDIKLTAVSVPPGVIPP